MSARADEILQLAPTPPCDGCRLAARCSSDRLACPDFVHYWHTGECTGGHRAPTHALYRRVMLGAPGRPRREPA